MLFFLRCTGSSPHGRRSDGLWPHHECTSGGVSAPTRGASKRPGAGMRGAPGEAERSRSAAKLSACANSGGGVGGAAPRRARALLGEADGERPRGLERDWPRAWKGGRGLSGTEEPVSGESVAERVVGVVEEEEEAFGLSGEGTRTADEDSDEPITVGPMGGGGIGGEDWFGPGWAGEGETLVGGTRGGLGMLGMWEWGKRRRECRAYDDG